MSYIGPDYQSIIDAKRFVARNQSLLDAATSNLPKAAPASAARGIGTQIAAEVLGGVLSALLDAHGHPTSSTPHDQTVSIPSDPILAAGEPPLKQSHLDRFVTVVSLMCGVVPTADEDDTLRAIVMSFWTSNSASEIRISSEFMRHATELTDPPAQDWVKEAQRLLAALADLPSGQALDAWASGITVRGAYLPDAIKAADGRRARDEAAAQKQRLTKVEAELAQATKEIKELKGALSAAREESQKVGQELYQVRTRLEEALVAELPSLPDNVEQGLRALLVKAAFPSGTIYIDPHIPPQKIFNARAACKVPTSEKVLALCDLTFFGSAKDALVFGVQSIYYRHKERSLQLPYAELAAMSFQSAPDGIKLSRADNRPLSIPVMTLGIVTSDTTARLADVLNAFSSFAAKLQSDTAAAAG